MQGFKVDSAAYAGYSETFPFLRIGKASKQSYVSMEFPANVPFGLMVIR
jgi:hypothetical protein